MPPIVAFLLFIFGFAACVVSAVTSPLWADRLIVTIMRRGHIYLFPMAIRLALSMETQGDEWELDDTRLQHPSIGVVWLVTDRLLQVQLKSTNQSKNVTWRPNWIERRIIRDAAEGLIDRRRVAQLDRSLPALPM
jgi:hypothetical protein